MAPLKGDPLRRWSHTEPGRPTISSSDWRGQRLSRTPGLSPSRGPGIVVRPHSSLATGLAAGVLWKDQKAEVPVGS